MHNFRILVYTAEVSSGNFVSAAVYKSSYLIYTWQ